MRVLVLCSDPAVRIGDREGAGLHLKAITSAFAALGHETEVVGVAAEPEGAHEPWPVPTHCIGYLGHNGHRAGPEAGLHPHAVVEHVAALAMTVAERLRPHLVYERLAPSGTAGLRVARSAGVLHVVEVNALLAHEAARQGPDHRQHAAEPAAEPAAEQALADERAVLAGAGLRVTVSEELAAAVRPLADERPVIVVPHGVDVELFESPPDRSAARRRLGLPATAPLACVSGSLRPGRGLEHAVASLSLLPDDVHLAVAGEGPGRGELEQMVAAHGLSSRVHWLGRLPHREVPHLLAACDVALAPYPELTGGAGSLLKVYEYLAAGIPVVGSDVTQVRDALGGGRWGRLVEPGDPGALAAAVSAVLDDPAAARWGAEQGRRHALAEHSWQNRARHVLTAAAIVSSGGRRAVAR